MMTARAPLLGWNKSSLRTKMKHGRPIVSEIYYHVSCDYTCKYSDNICRPVMVYRSVSEQQGFSASLIDGSFTSECGTEAAEKAPGERIKERSALRREKRKRETKDRRSYLHIKASGQQGLTRTSHQVSDWNPELGYPRVQVLIRVLSRFKVQGCNKTLALG